jgi:hypothetical protein
MPHNPTVRHRLRKPDFHLQDVLHVRAEVDQSSLRARRRISFGQVQEHLPAQVFSLIAPAQATLVH